MEIKTILRISLKLILFFLTTACLSTMTLKDGRTKVPENSHVYSNKKHFDVKLLEFLDTNVFYEEFNTRYNSLQRLDNHIETGFYAMYKFYNNGSFNLFYINKDIVFNENQINPSYTGKRGVYYLKNGEINYDLFAESNELGWIGKLTGTFTFTGDKLIVKRNVAPHELRIFIKRKLPSFLQYNADW